MNLVSEFDHLPPGGPELETYAMLRSGELRALGQRPKLTMGERVLGRYTKFYQVSTAARTQTDTFTARSAVGAYRFGLTLELDYRVHDHAAVAGGQTDVEYHLLAPIRRRSIEEAALFPADSFHGLEMRLKDLIDPKAAGPRYRGPFEVLDCSVQVEPPSGLSLDTADVDEIRNLPSKIAAALARGDQEKAQALTESKNFIESLQHERAETALSKADRIELIREKIRNFQSDGATRDSDEIKALQAEINAYLGGTGEAAPEATRLDADRRITEDTQKKSPDEDTQNKRPEVD